MCGRRLYGANLALWVARSRSWFGRAVTLLTSTRRNESGAQSRRVGAKVCERRPRGDSGWKFCDSLAAQSISSICSILKSSHFAKWDDFKIEQIEEIDWAARLSQNFHPLSPRGLRSQTFAPTRRDCAPDSFRLVDVRRVTARPNHDLERATQSARFAP